MPETPFHARNVSTSPRLFPQNLPFNLLYHPGDNVKSAPKCDGPCVSLAAVAMAGMVCLSITMADTSTPAPDAIRGNAGEPRM